MTRLIDADALKTTDTYALVNNKTDENGISFAPMRCVLKKDIDNAPTVDYPFYQEAYQTGYEEGQNARPKGKWIEENGLIACSNCHAIWLYRRTNFCPNCGADMRGGTE